MLRAVAAASGSSGIAIGDTVTSGTAGRILYVAAGPVLADSANLTFGTTAGQGVFIGAGTATTDVAALSVTRTNNNAAVATGVKFVFTDTTSAAGFLPLQILGGAAGTTNLISVGKTGNLGISGTGVNPYNLSFGDSAGIAFNGSFIWVALSGPKYVTSFKAAATGIGRDSVFTWSTDANDATAAVDTGISRLAAGVMGFGTGAAASVAGTLSGKYYLASVGNALTAVGTDRATALQLAATTNNITTAAGGTGVILPVGSIGMAIVVFNAGANLVQVYASASETIDGVAGATGVALTNAKRCIYYFTAANTWISAQLGVVSA